MSQLYRTTNWRRVLALVLVFVMMLSTMGTSGYSVFAENIADGYEAAADEPDEETDVIPDEETPLTPYEEDTEIDDGETPLAPYEEDTEIDDEQTPLTPFTGDDRNTSLWMAVSFLSLAGILLLGRRRKEEE